MHPLRHLTLLAALLSLGGCSRATSAQVTPAAKAPAPSPIRADTASLKRVLDSIADKRKGLVVDFAAVPFLDSTAANAMSRVAAKARRQGIRLFITGASPAVRRALLTHGVSPPRARYRESIARAVADIKAGSAKDAAAS